MENIAIFLCKKASRVYPVTEMDNTTGTKGRQMHFVESDYSFFRYSVERDSKDARVLAVCQR